ncbi:metal-sensitive transcriptional regulator [Pseudooceanicola nanhaiensis]
MIPCGVWFQSVGGQVAHEKQHKDTVLKRLARLTGQVQGVSHMARDDRYCADILNRTAAIRSALRAGRCSAPRLCRLQRPSASLMDQPLSRSIPRA